MIDPELTFVRVGLQKLHTLDQAEIALAVQMRGRDDYEELLNPNPLRAPKETLPFLEKLTSEEARIVKTNCLLRLRSMEGSFEGETA